MSFQVLRYPERFAFAPRIAELFGCTNLAEIGLCEAASIPLLERGSDQNTVYHRQFYAGYAVYLSSIYESFIRDFLRDELVQQNICYQSVPTFRIHLNNNRAVGEFHRDRDYNHLQGETNIWLPLTDAWGNNSIWIESEPDLGDFCPMTLQVGEMLIFDGLNLRHGNKLNDTGSTRLSLDFRYIPSDKFVESESRSISAGKKMIVGDYYSQTK